MTKPIRGSKISTVIVLVIFCVFAASVLTVLTLGGTTYKNITAMAHEGYDGRTCLSYVWAKVKNGDEYNRVYTDEFHDLSVLCLEEEYGGVVYQTLIYLYDGWVRELFFEQGLEFFPEDGLSVIKAESLHFREPADGLIEVTSDSGSLLIYPRGKGGVPID